MQGALLCEHPIFIIGSPRSGTTILAWSLAEHSELWTSEESEFLFDLFPGDRLKRCYERVFNRPHDSWLRAQGVGYAEFLEALGHGVNRLFSSRSRDRRWIEQTPQYALIADILALMFPGAYFLHILRDGRKVVRSMINVARKYSEAEKEARRAFGCLPSWPQDFRAACVDWRWSVERAMQFSAANPSRCLTVRNEALSTHPDKEFGKIFEFIGVKPEHGPANYIKNNRINSSFQNVTGGGPGEPSVAHGSAATTFASSRIEPDPWDEWTMAQKLIFIEDAAPAMFKYGLATPDELTLSGQFAPDRDYKRSIRLVLESVREATPYGATVIVISKGDDELLNLQGRRAWHFPRQDDGIYAGYYPENDQEAVDSLEGLRRQGGDYLVIPRSGFWWLDDYTGFRDHLDTKYARVFTDPNCVIYKLSAKG